MNKNNLTPLFKAIMLRPLSMENNVREIIKKEDVNELCCEGETFAYLYLVTNDVSVYRRELRENPKLNLNNANKHGETVLMALAKQGDYRESRKLIELGADWKMKDNKGKTAMDYACDYGWEEDPEILKGEEGPRDLTLFSYYQHLSGTLDPVYTKNRPF